PQSAGPIATVRRGPLVLVGPVRPEPAVRRPSPRMGRAGRTGVPGEAAVRRLLPDPGTGGGGRGPEQRQGRAPLGPAGEKRRLRPSLGPSRPGRRPRRYRAGRLTGAIRALARRALARRARPAPPGARAGCRWPDPDSPASRPARPPPR